MAFRVLNKNNKAYDLKIQGARSMDKSNDIATITFQNYDDDTKITYNTANIGIRDPFGDNTHDGSGMLIFRTNLDGSNLKNRMQINHLGQTSINTSNTQGMLLVDGDVYVNSNIHTVGLDVQNISNSVTNNLLIYNDTIFKGNLNSSNFYNSNITILGGYTVQNGTMITCNDVYMYGGMSNYNNANFSSNVNIKSNLTVSNDLSVFGNIKTNTFSNFGNTNLNCNVNIGSNLLVYGSSIFYNACSNLADTQFSSNIFVNKSIYTNTSISNLGSMFVNSNAEIKQNLTVFNNFSNLAVSSLNSVKINDFLSNIGNVSISSNLTVIGNMSNIGNVTNLSTLSNLGNANFGGSIYVLGIQSNNNNLSVNSNLQVTGNYLSYGNITLSNTGNTILYTSNNNLGVNIVSPRANYEFYNGDILSKNLQKTTKTLNTLSNITITINWDTVPGTGQYYIVVETIQQVGNTTQNGVRFARYTLSTVSPAINSSQGAQSWGNTVPAGSLNVTSGTATTKTLPLTSTTNWTGAGTPVQHTFTVNILHYPTTTSLGTVYLS